MLKKQKEFIERVLLNMNYDSKKTLTENKLEILSEGPILRKISGGIKDFFTKAVKSDEIKRLPGMEKKVKFFDDVIDGATFDKINNAVNTGDFSKLNSNEVKYITKILRKDIEFVDKFYGEFIDGLKKNNISEDEFLTLLKRDVDNGVDIDDAIYRALSGDEESADIFQDKIKKKYESKYSVKDPFVALDSDGLPNWIQSKWLMDSSSKMDYDTKVNNNVRELFNKVNKYNGVPFDPSKVKVVNSDLIVDFNNKHGWLTRPCYEIELPQGERVIMYVSTGTGAPGYKKAGDWQVINGFINGPNSNNYWYVKTPSTTKITGGASNPAENSYFGEMKEWLKKNDIEDLGKKADKKINLVQNFSKLPSGSKVSSDMFDNSNINWDKVANAKNMEDYNRNIIKPFLEGSLPSDYISSKGFENYGIDNFRDFLVNRVNRDEIITVRPDGSWSFIIK